MKNKLLENLNQELGSQVPIRRYNLADMISESYKVLYNCSEGSNLRKLAESHLSDLKENPRDISRLSRQLGIVKELVKLTESGELKDEDLVDERYHDQVEPQEERVLIKEEVLDEAKEEYVWGNWQIERNTPRKVKYYTAGKDILNKIIGVVYAPATDSFRYGAEIYNNETSETLIGYVEFDDEDTAIRWVEDKLSHQTPHVEETPKVEDTPAEEGATDEEGRKIHNPEDIKDSVEIKESVESLTWGDWQSEKGNPHKVKYYSSGQDLTNQTIGVVYAPSQETSKYGAEIYDNKIADTIEGINEFDSEEEAITWIESWFQSPVDESTTTEGEEIKEAEEPEPEDLTDEELEELAKHLETIRKERKENKITESEESVEESTNEGSKIKVDIYVDGEFDKSKYFNDMKDARKWVDQFNYDADGDDVATDPEVVKESVYEGLENFKKQSESKAFYKTFKRMNDVLKEGKELSRQESIDLYKASNSALTQLSIELEHNPDFLETFKESVSILSKDVNSLLTSLTTGEAPSVNTVKSLARFSEALLTEAEYEDDVEFPVEETPDDFVGDDEGDIEHEPSEEEEKFDQEYADGREELHNELADEFEETEDEFVQDKLEADRQEVAELLGEDPEEVADEETPVDDFEDEVVDDITDDELEELKKHLREMRAAKIKESTDVGDLFSKVRKALDDAGIKYQFRGNRRDMFLVDKEDLDKASELRDKIDPEYKVKVMARA